ncbi:hypothetical protein JR316_0002061 [Psilocybe cubensis]|uniref:Uncharacterized protein n=2 Tax=Psilocybe cubensis TaxID=181762 RepID=A0ACB8HBD7_PSICU|nr:hypothetical protein JR316_0002061 [Psilocybe cubensis]KAH9485154.1 hypothetical protein JR316_0002061 [Psilocybe cubensis]
MDLIHRLALRAQESTPVTPSQDTQESVIKILDSVLATEEYPSDHAPPLDIIVYALNNILRPAFLPELMSDFLHLFTMVEFYRRRVVEKASLAIEMNTFYSDNSQANVVLLDDEDKRILKSFVDEQKHGRRIFLKVIKECCIQDLERLWLMDSNVDYWVRCHEYLSIRGSPVTFRFGLTDKESEDFERGVILKLKDFMYSTMQTGEQLPRKGWVARFGSLRVF